MKRRASSSDSDEQSHPAKVPDHKIHSSLSTEDLPNDVMNHIITNLQLDELSICSVVSKRLCELVDRRCKEIIQLEWKSHLEPSTGSWRFQLLLWSSDFSDRKHGLPKVRWCVENGADIKLYSLLHSPPPHRKRILRLLNPPTMLTTCSGVFAKWLSVIPYSIIHEHFHVDWFNLDSWWTWLIILLAVDCGYYWAHREMHMINIGWAGHAAHHSSEYFNLTTAVRQSGLGHYLGWIFYLPLAFFFPASLYIFHYRMNLVYQYWIHTDLVTKTHPWIEYIFNTPSHHRVHHARNPEYLDKNFGGMLIIWDRLFGTFAEEKTTPVYGLVHTLQTWGAVWSQAHHVVYILTEISTYKRISNKIAVMFAPPGWTVDEKTNQWVAPELVPIDPKQKQYTTAIPNSITAYLLFRFAITAFVHYRFATIDATVLCIYIIFCLETYSMIMDRKGQAFKMELNRSAFDVIVASYFFLFSASDHLILSSLGVVAFLSSLLWLASLRDDFRTFEMSKKKIIDEKVDNLAGTGSL